MPWYRYNMSRSRTQTKNMETMLISILFFFTRYNMQLFIYTFFYFARVKNRVYVTATYAVSLKDFRLPSHNVIEKIGKTREKSQHPSLTDTKNCTVDRRSALY
jgi:hypothetical protein